MKAQRTRGLSTGCPITRARPSDALPCTYASPTHAEKRSMVYGHLPSVNVWTGQDPAGGGRLGHLSLPRSRHTTASGQAPTAEPGPPMSPYARTERGQDRPGPNALRPGLAAVHGIARVPRGRGLNRVPAVGLGTRVRPDRPRSAAASSAAAARCRFRGPRRGRSGSAGGGWLGCLGWTGRARASGR